MICLSSSWSAKHLSFWYLADFFLGEQEKSGTKKQKKENANKTLKTYWPPAVFPRTSLYMPRLNPRLNLVWQPPLLFRPRLEDSGWCGSGHSRHQSIIIPAQIGGRLHTASRRKGPFVNLRASLMNRQCCSRSALFRLKMEIADISHLNCFQARLLVALYSLRVRRFPSATFLSTFDR